MSISNKLGKAGATRDPNNTPVSVQGKILGRESEMAANRGGGVGFINPVWVQLDRFLLIGVQEGTWVVSDSLVRIGADCVKACLGIDYKRTIDRAVYVSEKGLAKNNDYALYVIAVAAGSTKREIRKYALSKLNEVARTGTHLFHFMEMVKFNRGRGRLFKEAVTNWYKSKPIERLAYQVVKYKQRDGWSHRDVLRLVRPKADTPEENSVYKFAVKGELDETVPPIIMASEIALINPDDSEMIKGLIQKEGLTWEMLPSECLNVPEIWKTLLQEKSLPLNALMRNLGRMSSLNITNSQENEDLIISRLTDRDEVKKARIHPLNALLALITYGNGSGHLGSLSWRVNSNIKKALEETFYASFDYLPSTGKKFLLAVDVSGSMSSNAAGATALRALDVSACMALLLKKVEKESVVLGFSDRLTDLGISSKDSLEDARKKCLKKNFGTTYCSLPVEFALNKHLHVDCFVVITDNDANGGSHTSQVFDKYQKEINQNAKLVVLSVTAGRTGICDPKNRDMLDIVGFSPEVPKIINWFASSKFEG